MSEVNSNMSNCYMLHNLEDVGEGSRCTDEVNGTLLGERSEVIVLIATIVDQQSCEMLLAVHPERNAELTMASATVATHGEEGRLRTQDGHVAKWVSDVRPLRERAGLCGVRGGIPLETLSHRSFGWQQEGTNRPSTLTLGRREVNNLRGCDRDRSSDGREGAADILEHFLHCCTSLRASLPFLRGLEGLVRSLGATNGRGSCCGGSYGSVDA